MLYLVIILFIIGIISIFSSIYTMPAEVRNSLSPQDIEIIDEELKSRKYIGQIFLMIACLITSFYLIN
jgi:hypothetical protein